MDLLRVSATAAGVSYYPEFVARELGYFRDEELEVVTEAPGHGPFVVRALSAGAADVALGGIWRPLMYRGRLDHLVAFAQLCIRCATRVISRTPLSGFEWSAFEGKRVIVPDGSPTPGVLVDALVRRANVDTTKVTFIRDFLSAEAMALYRAGLGDFILAGPPAAEQLVADGLGVQVASLAREGGRLPWSVYYATPGFLARDDQLAGRFTKALIRALRWVADHDPNEVAVVFDKHFRAYAPEVVAGAVQASREEGIWPDSARLDGEALARWQEIILEAGLIDRAFAYDDIFDARAVDWAERELAGSGGAVSGEKRA